jgi:hypothetical protein
MSSNATDFFPKIGTVVEGQSQNGVTRTNNEEEQLVQEIESLCMNCHEQVGFPTKYLVVEL